MGAITLYGSAALLSAALTWAARRYAVARRLVDQPGERRSHQAVTPRGGGIAIVGVMLVGLLWGGPALQMAIAWPAAVGLVLVAGVGWWDDHRPLSARLRLAAHIVAAVLLGAAFHRAGLQLPGCIVLGAAAVVLVNVWNFMDGINGLATSQAILVAATAAMLAGPASPGWSLGWLLVAACIGFMPFNFPRARIFLGDVGSGALGYLLALLAGLLAIGHGDGFARSEVVWLLLLPASAFLVDASLTLGRRILRRERWWEPHVQHAYQALARRSGHTATTLAYGMWSAVGLGLASTLGGDGPVVGFMMCAAVAAWQGMGACWWWYLQDFERRMTARGPRT